MTVEEQNSGEVAIVFPMNPPKTDPTGHFKHVSAFLLEPPRRKISAANAINTIWLGDPAGSAKAGEDMSHIPLFRDPQTGKEMTRACFDAWLAEDFAAAGLVQFTGKSNSLRIGGATTLFE